MVTGSVGVGVVGLGVGLVGVGDGVGEGVGAGVGLHAKTGVSYDAGLEKRGSLLPVTCAHHFASKSRWVSLPVRTSTGADTARCRCRCQQLSAQCIMCGEPMIVCVCMAGCRNLLQHLRVSSSMLVHACP